MYERNQKVSKTNIQVSIDNGRLMTKLSAVSLIFSVCFLILTAVLGSMRGGDVFRFGLITYTLSALFSFGALIYGIFSTQAGLENEEKKFLEERSNAENRALNVEEDVRFTAQRSFDNYRRFAPYALALAGALVTGGFLFYFQTVWGARPAETVSMSGNALYTALIAIIMMLLNIFIGAFYVGQSRSKAFRWLRAVGAWLIVGFAVMAGATVTALLHGNNIPAADLAAGKVFFWIFVSLGAEFVTNFIIEFYRPRTLKESRPVFESRLLALFTEPGGVMRNIAAALDYQFGFKVSGTWLYGFVERSFFPLFMLVVIFFLFFSSIHEVGPSQVGVRENLGCVEKKLLTPGIYWSLPWPFGSVSMFSTSELRQIVIGEKSAGNEDLPDDLNRKAGTKRNAEISETVLWTKAHGGGEDSNFLVAVKPSGTQAESKDAAAAPSISFIRLTMPIQYRISNVFDYAYGNANPVYSLRRIGQQAATEYLASTSMMELMSSKRQEAQKAIMARVQQLADQQKLGIKVETLLILDAHPPIEKVAPAYQEVIGAMEQKETAILGAQAYRIKTEPEAKAEAARIVAEAKAYSSTTGKVAQAESERFRKQLTAYTAMPSVFKLRELLNFLAVDCAGIRKYVVPLNNESEVYELNFEAKERLDLIDTDVTKLSNK